MNSKHFIFLTCATFLASCSAPKSEVKTETIKIEIPNIDTTTILSGLVSCNKNEETQDFLKVDASNVLTVTDSIPTQDFEVKDCDGKVTRKGNGPIREVAKTLDVPKPTSLEAELSFVEVTNDRTCKTLRASVVKNDEFQNYDLLADGSQLTHLTTRANEDGELKILVNDSTWLYYIGLNIADGKNVLTIKYYGECLEQKENPTPNAGPSVNCKRAKEIGSQIVGVDLKVERNAIEGIREINECKTSK